MLYLIVPLIAAEIIAMTILGALTIASLEHYVHIGPILVGCYTVEVYRRFTFYAVPPLVMAVLMFSMTAFKCGATFVTLGPRRAPIIALFLRDGLFWFLAGLLVSIVEIVLWDKSRPTLAEIPVIPATAGIAMIGARVVLNIKNITANTGLAAGATTVDTELVVFRPGTTQASGIDIIDHGANSERN
ncbi:hypothetical protein DFH06DRAFT_1333562 [Mycena polygramma]|nr:hypothetical protein DFH06DRAFT_1333562 [Mycena polygramma]